MGGCFSSVGLVIGGLLFVNSVVSVVYTFTYSLLLFAGFDFWVVGCVVVYCCVWVCGIIWWLVFYCYRGSWLLRLLVIWT